jgi:hypothetical protein
MRNEKTVKRKVGHREINMKHPAEQHVMYRSNGEGQWFRTIWESQCPSKDVCGLKCQGIDGHMGCHWAYKQDGSYAFWKNETDKDLDENIAGGWTPPDHDSYVNPADKYNDYYMKHSSSSEVLDKDIIKSLEMGISPEPHASIDTPISEEEVRQLRAEGILPED